MFDQNSYRSAQSSSNLLDTCSTPVQPHILGTTQDFENECIEVH